MRRREELEARQGVDLGRMARRGFGSAAYAAAVLAIAVLLIAISARYRTLWDFTAQKENSLAPQTLAVLDALEEPVRIVALFTDSHPERQGYWESLERFRRRTPLLAVEFVDPVARPGEVRALGLSTEELGSRRDGLTVVIRGGRRLLVRDTKEESLTNAILEVGSTDPRIVGIVRGYGEADPASRLDRGFSRAREALESEYYGVVDVVLGAGVPPEVSVLLFPGPQQPIPEGDLAALDAWIGRGGRVLALLDPGADVATGLRGVLENHGLRLGDAQVLEPQSDRNRNGNPEFLRVVEYSQHAAVRGFGPNLPTEFPIVASVDHFEPGDPTYFHDALVRSSRFAIGILPDGTREQGPFDLAAVSWKRLSGSAGAEREIRVALFGDADFPLNAYLAVAANRNLFLNTVGWLSQAKGLVTIRRQPLEGQLISLSESDDHVSRIGTFAAPLLVLLVGTVVLLRRWRL